MSDDVVTGEPKISVIVPVYNGAKNIETCLRSILSQDYAADKLEIFVVDGCSTDGTHEIVSELGKSNPAIRLLDNPRKVKPVALNLAIKQCSAELICIVDVLSCLESDYLSECVRVLQESGADNVGGAMRPVSKTFVGKAIAIARSSIFGLGGGRFHDPTHEGYVDTVYLGFYRREVFDKVGLFDEAIVRGQDHELNCRIRKAGGKIYMSSQVRSCYYCRENWHTLATQLFRTGRWNVKKIQRNPDAFALRHWVPFGFVTTLIALALLSLVWKPFLYVASGILSLYLAANLIVSTLLAAQKGLKYLPLLPIVFAIMHFCYGFGTISGLLRFGLPARALIKGACHWCQRRSGDAARHSGESRRDPAPTAERQDCRREVKIIHSDRRDFWT
jgi:glycosyltransferase involved in cell wall biosynthesis